MECVIGSVEFGKGRNMLGHGEVHIFCSRKRGSFLWLNI